MLQMYVEFAKKGWSGGLLTTEEGRVEMSRLVEILRTVASDHGHHMAAMHLGNSYSLGLGVVIDAHESALWLRKAAELGNSGAMIRLASILEKGNVPLLHQLHS